MKPPLTPSQQAVRLQGRHRVIGVATLMLLVVVFVPWLLGPSRAPRNATGQDSEPFASPGVLAGSANDLNAGVPPVPNMPLPQYASSAPTVASIPMPEAASPVPTVRGDGALPAEAGPIRPDQPAASSREPSTPPQGGLSSVVPTLSSQEGHSHQEQSPTPPQASTSSPATVQTLSSQEGHSHQDASSTPHPEVASDVSHGNIVVQVGVFTEQAKAKSLLKKLSKQGIHAHMETAHFKEGTRLRVRIGPLKTRAELKKLTQHLDQMGIKSMLVAP